MSDRKPTNNTSNTKDIDDDQSHSDSDETIEEKPTGLIIKSEKKKQIQTNFGRPRKHPYKPGKYKCMYCETMCSKPSVLTKHLRAHTNERPFPCSLCKRSFKTKSNLSKHEKSKSHSSKLEEKNEISPSKRDIMLQALSNIESSFTGKRFEPMNNLEFDSIDRKTSIVQSNCSSPVSSDHNSNTSSEHCISDIVKKEKRVESSDMNDDVPEKVENSSSCSGVLTINSQGGPITVEVQINLETMRHLQQGLSNMTNKINSPLLPNTNPTQRNDAELRAAESILHMANQRPQIQESCSSTDEYRKNGTTVKKVAGTLSPLNNKSPDTANTIKPFNGTKLSSSKDNNSYRATPLDESDPLNSKIHTKCLVKENLLKKMKRKQVQEINSLSDSTEFLPFNNSNISNTKLILEKTTESLMLPSITRPTYFQQSLKNETVLKNLITDSKSTSSFLLKSNRPRLEIYNKAGISNTNSQILNSLSTLSSPQTIVVITSPNSFAKNLTSSPKSVPDAALISISESNKSSLEIDTATLSKVITNTQSLHQHQGNKTSNMDNLSVTNSITTSRVAISPSCINSRNITLDNAQDQDVKEESPDDTKQPSKPTCIRQLSVQAMQESETESSPRLCIVEETTNLEPVNFDKKSSESDEEIDVVNTDSDDDRLPLQRIPEVNYSNESVSKRRKLDESDSNQMDGKRMKEVEKCVHLHAPNINAKDLMQDCPLNLSANRQPTIPPVSQISDISVLQNIYQSISPSTVNISLNNAANIGEVNSPINALTNHNPAHPQSFQNIISSSSLPTNGHHHHDYPIFEDKIACDVCGQSLDPSMLNLHKNMHIYTNSKDSHSHVNNNNNSNSSNNSNNSNSNNNNNNITKSGYSATISSGSSSLSSKIPFNKPRTYKCVVCNTGFRVIGHLRKHHKSKSHLQGLVNSGLLSKALFTKIEQSKVPIQEVIDQKTGNIIPDVLSRYISNWSQSNTDNEPHH